MNTTPRSTDAPQYTTRFGRRIRVAPTPSHPAYDTTSSDDSDYVPPSGSDTDDSDDSMSTVSLVSERSVDSAGTPPPPPPIAAIPRHERFKTPSVASSIQDDDLSDVADLSD